MTKYFTTKEKELNLFIQNRMDDTQSNVVPRSLMDRLTAFCFYQSQPLLLLISHTATKYWIDDRGFDMPNPQSPRSTAARYYRVGHWC